MIKFFDLSTGMSAAMPDKGQTHKDVQKIKPELKNTTDPDEVYVEEKLTAGLNYLSRKSNATSLKMLLAEETSKEVESKRKPPSVVARLMGLEIDLPAKEPVWHHAKTNITKSQTFNHLKLANKVLQPQGKQHCIWSLTHDIHPSCETVEYNDVYEACEEQARMSSFRHQTSQEERYSRNKSDRMDILQEKFMETKCFATEENLLHSVLGSIKDKDLFLKFVEEPNSILRQLSGFQTTSAPPQTKRITVLKPVRSVESNGIRQSRAERIIEKNDLEMRKFHRRSSSKERIQSQPSRIILLRPTPGFTGAVQDISEHRQNCCHQRDESLLSSACSNGYGGDESSFSDSEIDHSGDSETDYIEEDGGTFSDSEGGTPPSKYSWDYIRRYGISNSGSSFNKMSEFPESSVIKEAKQRLSERWTMVTCDEISQSQVQLPRSTYTLGEMLSLQEMKKEDLITGVHSGSGNRSCGTESETDFKSYICH